LRAPVLAAKDGNFEQSENGFMTTNTNQSCCASGYSRDRISTRRWRGADRLALCVLSSCPPFRGL